MTVHALFEHDDGYKFNQVYASKKQFLASLRRGKKVTFIHAMDTEKAVVIYPSTLYDYKQMN